MSRLAMCSRWLLLAVVLFVVCVGSARAQDANDFESDLADSMNELDLSNEEPASFMTLSDMGEELSPEASFAEIDAQHHTADDASGNAEMSEEDAALMEIEAAAAPVAAPAPAQPQQTAVAAAPKAQVAHQKSAAPAAAAAGQLPKNGDLDASMPWHRNDANQPVARHNAEITCLDGDCTRAMKVKKAAVGTHPNANTKPPPSKLDIALGAVKEEIMVRAKELHLEKDWSTKVASLIDQYQQKLSKVSSNIVSLRAQTKALLRKKKQIQNVQVQNKLRYKLKLAQADLNRLQKQMEHIAGKENEFGDTERQLKATMNALKNSLLKLRGQEPKKLMAEGIDVPLP